MTLIGQTRDQRPPFSRADAETIQTPTLFIGGVQRPMAIFHGTFNGVSVRHVAVPLIGKGWRDSPFGRTRVPSIC